MKTRTSADRAKLYRRIMDQLILILGGRCAECGRKDRIVRFRKGPHSSKRRRGHLLEINHKFGRDWEPRKTSRWQRAIIYRREAAEGLLNLLCRSCNGSYRPPRVPF